MRKTQKLRVGFLVSKWDTKPKETYHFWIEVVENGWVEFERFPETKEQLEQWRQEFNDKQGKRENGHTIYRQLTATRLLKVRGLIVLVGG